MFEYTVMNGTKYCVLRGSSVEWTTIKFATVFKTKSRAEATAKRCNGVVEPFYGRPVASNKSFVAPKQSPINHKSPYRSC